MSRASSMDTALTRKVKDGKTAQSWDSQNGYHHESSKLDQVDVNLGDQGGAASLLPVSSGGGRTERAELSKPDKVDANHKDNARELLPSDLSSFKPVQLSVKYITNNKTDILLGTGAFGNAYLGEDKELSTKFVVKAIKFTRNDQTAIDEIRNIFQQDISAITASGHPNFLSLYGYSLNVDHVSQYLVYKLPVHGPLSTFLRDGGGNKAALTADIRLFIMGGLARAIVVLHNDGHCRAGGSFFHRDIQSDNIYLTEHFTPQLMDCGLSKFVPINNDSTFTTTLMMNDSPATHAYMDPKFLENAKTNPYSYQSAYDVYSIGVVMVELIVGCLIVSERSMHGTKNSEVFRHCVKESDGNPVPSRFDELKKSADTIQWSHKSLDLVCDAAICCTKPVAYERISTKHLLLQLQEAILHSGDVGHNSDKYNCAECWCFVCGCHKSSRICNQGHAVCPRCIEDNIYLGLSYRCQQVCPLKGCRSSDDYLFGYISCEVYDLYLANRDPRKKSERKSVL